eukprot:gb/GEZN01009115.1/.p1 GENE.gb/GEZN01009115.1/~~gb/GEZN01009115.1/.p1  ORF type:complete len:419 (+),score=113.35 gb/GEZN01009115.1/:32-1288(+)
MTSSSEVTNDLLKEAMETGAACLCVRETYDTVLHDKLEKSSDAQDQAKAAMLKNLLAKIDPGRKYKNFCLQMMMVSDLGHIKNAQIAAGFKEFTHILHDARLPAILDTLPDAAMPYKTKAVVKELWEMNFNLPQYCQGEAPCTMLGNLASYLKAYSQDTERMDYLNLYLHGAIFDIAGANSQVKFTGLKSIQFTTDIVEKFQRSIATIMEHVQSGDPFGKNALKTYLAVLGDRVTDPACKSRVEEIQNQDIKLAVLRVLAMNRFKDQSVKHVDQLIAAITRNEHLVQQLGVYGKITLYFSPKFVQEEMKKSTPVAEIVEKLDDLFKKAEEQHAIVYNVSNPKEILLDPHYAEQKQAEQKNQTAAAPGSQEAEEAAAKELETAAAGDTAATNKDSGNKDTPETKQQDQAKKAGGCCAIL